MRFSSLFAAGLALLLSALPAHAGPTLRYPASKPAIIVDVPEGWSAEEDKADTENHKLTFSNDDGKGQCQIILMTLGKLDPKQYKSMVTKMGKTSADNAKMDGPEFTGPMEFESATGVPLTWEKIRGKIDGSDITLMIGLLTQKGMTYAVIISSESTVLADSAKTADAIIDSIQTLK